MKDIAMALFLALCVASISTCTAVERTSSHKTAVELKKLEINKPSVACGEGNKIN